MSVKKLGRAIADLENELWGVEGRNEKFHMNLRLVSSKPEVKAARSAYSKISSKDRPSLRKPNKRENFLKEVDLSKEILRQVLEEAYEAVKEDSRQIPVRLWKDKDFGKKMDWRFCLYKGIIYQLDHQRYTDEEIVQQISALEAKSKPASSSLP